MTSERPTAYPSARDDIRPDAQTIPRLTLARATVHAARETFLRAMQAELSAAAHHCVTRTRASEDALNDAAAATRSADLAYERAITEMHVASARGFGSSSAVAS